MNKRIDVPGVGIVEFPESMSDEQITNAIRTNILPKYTPASSTMQAMGRGLASGTDTLLNTLTGTIDVGARALARAYHGGLRGKSTEEAERLAQQEGTSPKDIVGRMFGVAGTPEYENAPLRQLGRDVGQTVGENVIQPIASATGLPEGYVGDVVNLGTAAVAPAVPKVARTVATPITETAIGFRQGLAQPKYQRGAQSSFVPLQEKFYPSKQVDPFMKATPEQRVAMLPELEASKQPSSSLFTSTPGMLARNLGPKAEGQTLIPYRGETMRAFGEQLARDISDRPLVSGGLGLGGAVLGGLVGGIPGALIGGAIAPGVRAGQLGSISTLGRTARFSRGFPEALGEAQSTAGRQMMTPGPVAPQLGYTPSPVIAAGTQPRTVNIEGQSYNLPYQINTSQAQTARAPQTATPVPDLAQLAAQRSAQEAARSSSQVRQTAAQQVTGPVDPTGILAQIRARQNKPPAPPPEPTGGVTVAPPTPPTPAGGGSLFDPQNFNKLSDKDKLSVLRQRMSQEPQQTMTAAQEKQMRSQITESSKATSQDIINDFASKGSSEKAASTTPIDTGKDAYNGSRATQGMAKALIKKGIDEIPVIQGMSESQVINAIHSRISKRKGPGNVSQMLIDEDYTNPQRTIDILKGEKSYPNAEQSYRTIRDYPEIDNTNKMQGAQIRTLKNEKNIKVEQVMLYDSRYGPISTSGGYDTHIVVTSPQGKATKRYSESKYNYNELGEPVSVTLDLKDGTNIMYDVVSDYIELRKGNQTGIWSDGELIAAENLMYPDVPNVLKIVDDLEYGDPVSLGTKLKKPINLD